MLGTSVTISPLIAEYNIRKYTQPILDILTQRGEEHAKMTEIILDAYKNTTASRTLDHQKIYAALDNLNREDRLIMNYLNVTKQ
jgi:hypothetical protein